MSHVSYHFIDIHTKHLETLKRRIVYSYWIYLLYLLDPIVGAHVYLPFQSRQCVLYLALVSWHLVKHTILKMTLHQDKKTTIICLKYSLASLIRNVKIWFCHDLLFSLRWVVVQIILWLLWFLAIFTKSYCSLKLS